jgi:hypothetical protein
MIYAQAICFFFALLTSIMFVHDFVGNMIFIHKDDEKSVKRIYPYIPAFFWTAFVFGF